MNRSEQLAKIDKDGWFRAGLKGRVSMVSTVKQPQNRKFSFNNYSEGKK